MRLIIRRASVVYVLIAAFAAGLIFFSVSYFANASQWVMHEANEHIYSGANLAMGNIYDHNGTMLIASADGERIYNDDQTIREATLHTVGDTGGYIATGVQSTYRTQLLGYNIIDGVYNISAESTGNNITLTIDADVCAAALEALDGRDGAVCVYNYQTGEIVAMVSTPTYDPLDKPDIDGDESGEWDGVYMNKALSGSYTPGSIFKIVTAAAAIENIPDIYSRTFFCEGEVSFADGTVTCLDYHGEQTFEQALNHSCNSAFAQIAVELGREKLTAQAQKMGFDQQLMLEQTHCATGNFDVSDAGDAELGWAGIGQYTDTVSPYQMMVMMGAIAGDGAYVKPHLVEKITTPIGFPIKIGMSGQPQQMLEPDVAAKLSDLLRSNVINEYGDDAFPGLTMCGKTGTAEVGDGERPHAWFVGFSRDPQTPLAIALVIENGGSAAANAIPAANEIMQAAADSLS